MRTLNARALAGLLNLVVVMAISIFVPAWTIHYWQAWLFLAVFFACVLAITIYLMKNDPQLLSRRVQAGPIAEHQARQKLLQTFAALAFLATLIVPALDHRFDWSRVSGYLVASGDLLIAIGLSMVFLVFRANTFTSATIEVDTEQHVVSTGPYAVVRHPMYAGAAIMLCGIPLALGSWWGLLGVVALTVVIVFRLLDEERFLTRNLAGYVLYRNQVRFRLVPRVW